MNLREYFQYHPPVTEERKEAHQAINDAAFAFAEIVVARVKDEDTRKMAIFAIQQARMFANQGITIDEIKGTL